MLPKILVAESSGFSKSAAGRLRACGRLVMGDLDRRSLLAAVSDAEILWVRLRHRIDREVMDCAPILRAIATPTTGLNHVDLAEAGRRNIQVISLQGATEFLQNVYATAEHTIALILGLLRHLSGAHQHVIKGDWNRDLFVGRELHGKRAGVIGCGRVGRMVAGYLRGLGMRVLVTDVQNINRPAHLDIELVSLTHLLYASDIVTLHIPLSDRTKGFFGEREFSEMKPGSWFINTSRGELVDEGAMLKALSDGRLAGAALDVLCDENSSGMRENFVVQYAREHNNVLLTPHIGGCTGESREKTENFIATQVAGYVRAHFDEPLSRAHQGEAARRLAAGSKSLVEGIKDAKWKTP
jgi:D-3-phosphoglycerate dehydrogenase / 2-oxoglutarate reductase